MGVKQCRKCKKEKDLEEFHKGCNKRDGRHSYCKVCAGEGAKQYYQKNKQNVLNKANEYNRTKQQKIRLIVEDIKHKEGCCFCRENEPCCLDFHHPIDGDKRKGVSELVRAKNVHKLIEELKRCICVCASCHRKIHAGILDATGQPLVNDFDEDAFLECLVYKCS